MVNIGVIMGRLTADPELRVTPSNVKTTTFTVAVERRFTQNGERQADFIDVVAWRQCAEFICKHFSKGQMIAIQGSLQTRTYKDKNVNTRKVTELVADAVSFCGSGRSGAPENENIPEYREIPDEDLPFN